jgi:hypothetical protein
MAETTGSPAAGLSFSGMLADPNFQLLLANMGKSADPDGAGGVIGGATANMISSKAAQGAIDKRDAARKAQIQKLIDLHGGITPPDKPGLNSMKMTPSGALNFELNLGSGNEPEGTGTVLAPPVQPVRTQPLTGTTPTQQAPIMPAPSPAASAPARQMLASNRPSLDEIFPFY